MPLTAAKFSTHMAAFVGQPAISAAFPRIFARQVNVLRHEEFPLLAYWVDDADRDADGGSDGEDGQEVTYGCLVAARLEEGQAQDAELGKLIKVIKDLAGGYASADGVEFTVGRWSTDSNAENGDGTVVWASSAIVMRYSRPRNSY